MGSYTMETSEELGTTDIDSKMSRKKDNTPDFKEELRILRRELKKLGLKK